MNKLNKNMSLLEFEHGYFYATELKAFARTLGIEVGTLRKNEIEEHIKAFLSGKYNTPLPRSVSNRKNKRPRDKLFPDSFIVNYIDDKETKIFLKQQVLKKNPKLKDKSGQWYWLNDWRKQQIGKNRKITYQHLIERLYQLMITQGRLPNIPSTRFNNFISEFLADPDNSGMSRQQAMDQWEKLKKIPIRKNYQEYKKFRNTQD